MTGRRSFLKSAGIARKTYLTVPMSTSISGRWGSAASHPSAAILLPAYLIPAAPYTFEFTITHIWKN